jgi:hypothetical protein
VSTPSPENSQPKLIAEEIKLGVVPLEGVTTSLLNPKVAVYRLGTRHGFWQNDTAITEFSPDKDNEICSARCGLSG